MEDEQKYSPKDIHFEDRKRLLSVTLLYLASIGVLNSFYMTAEHGQWPNADNSQLNPENIHRLKDRILAVWDQMPTEYQATMTLVLLENTLQSEWGKRLTYAIEKRLGQGQERSERTFPVISLRRSALKRAFDEEEIGRLTDKEIAQIAEEIGIGFDQDPGFWYTVEMVGRRLLEDRD